MHYSNKKTTLVAGAIFSAILITSMTAFSPKEKPSTWKNLKVLPQDITKDSLMGLMHHYNEALGVKCTFCHAEGKDGKRPDFSSDDKKEKGFARHMILMTREINSKNFNWAQSAQPDTINIVTCWTCHRGKAEVEKFVPKEHPGMPGEKH